MKVRVARLAELPPATLYDLLRLRIDVFVTEQRCAYSDLDGRDAEPDTRHLWLADDNGGTDGNEGGDAAERDGAPLGYLRLLEEPDGSARIGRVCVAGKARGTGVAKRLMYAALDLVGDRPCVLSAQSHLVDFYGRFGFTPCGEEYLDEGMPHTPMRRPAR